MLRRCTPVKGSAIRSRRKEAVILLRGGREVCQGGAWEQRRREVCGRAAERCEECGGNAPLHDQYDEDGEVVAVAGHAHHRNGTRGLGGGKRDDSVGNLRWLCSRCHWEAHTPAKVVPAKPGRLTRG